MKTVTNGTSVKVETSPGIFKEVPRRFSVPAEHGDFVWVMAVNGHFTGEGPLTFRKSALKDLI